MKTDIKVLIVDDSMLGRVSLKSMLNNLGVTEIIEASNGQLALKQLQAESPHLIILDLLMPEMDGFQVLEEKRRINIDCEVVVLSADIQETTEKRALELGAKYFLYKPVKEKELERILNNIFQE